MSICQNPANEPLCEMFVRLHQIRVEQGETHRAKAYVNAISAVQNYPGVITSGKMAKTIPGIGERLATRIDELLSTGRLVELDGPHFRETPTGNNEIELLVDPQWAEEQAKRDVLSLFQTIHGVGPVTALKWYDLGYRRLEEVPLEIMTNAQQIGLAFRDELNQRIPRDEIALIDQQITATLAPYGISHKICGSYLRGRSTCGDIDILLVAQPELDVVSIMLSCPVFTHQLGKGKKKFLGIGQLSPDHLHRRIDIEIVQPEEYPFALLYFTGPKSFNQKMRAHFEEMGYRLNEKSLVDIHGNKYPALKEADVFEMGGLLYLTPEERDKY